MSDKLTVFLVEDEINMREGMKNNIPWEAEGFSFIGEASDGELAYPMIKKLVPDIIITDIKMPFMDGLELSRIVKKELPGVKIIILSGYDEFAYAKKAISIGVTEYLLKPISPEQLVTAVKSVARMIEKERQDQKIIARYRDEMLERAEVDKQKFFNRMLEKPVSMTEAIEIGSRLGLDIGAAAYNTVLFHISGKDYQEDFSEEKISAAAAIEAFAGERTDCILFKRGSEEWAVLIKGEDLQDVNHRAVEICSGLERILLDFKSIVYFGGIGKEVSRIRDLQLSYREAGKAFAMRFFVTDSRFVSAKEGHAMLSFGQDEIDLEAMDVRKMGKEAAENFLKRGMPKEADNFIEEYYAGLGAKNMESYLFRQYVVLDLYFCVISFLEELGIDRKELVAKYGDFNQASECAGDQRQTREFLSLLFSEAIRLRDSESMKKYSALLKQAKEYIRSHYDSEEISLQSTAASVNMSPSYFSSVFRQETGQTFIEYLTAVRMERARELLMCTNKKTAEIGYEVGYKDSHYFSYIFKKTQDCSPKEYRSRGREEEIR